MTYKKGDKLLCKKNLTHVCNSIDIDTVKFFSGRWYEFSNYHSMNNKKPHAMGILIPENINWDFSFFLKRKKIGYYIWDYFCTENEIRKIKLKKLGNKN